MPAEPRLQPAPDGIDVVRGELSRLRAIARAWAATLSDQQGSDHAARFATRALHALAANVAPAYAPRHTPRTSVQQFDKKIEMTAILIGEAAARLPIEEALHFVTGLYPALLPARIRSAHGAFYTPPALVNCLLDRAEQEGLDWRTARLLDPAAGGGAFLIEAARRMVSAQPDCEPAFLLAQIGSRLVGFELDPRAAGLCQEAIEILLADLAEAAGRLVPPVVQVCDTLTMAPQATFDLVVGNPPFGRVTLSPEQRRHYARGLHGHANLYGLFIDVALRWTKPGGLIAYLTPTSFLGGHYFTALRELLAKEAPPLSIDFVHARRGVFEDVLQETLLAVYKRGIEPSRTHIHYITLLGECEARVVRNGTIALPPDPKSPWLAPRRPEHSRLIAFAETMKCRLDDWGYSVSTGPLVWNRFKDQLRDRADGKAVHPLIWAEAVTPDGRFVYPARKRNHAPFFKLMPGDAWLLVEEPCVLVQRTTAKEQSRRLVATELPADFIAEHGGVVVENHLNMVRAHNRPVVPPTVVAALLNSWVADEMFRCISGSVAVSAFELEALPLPSASATTRLEELVSAGAPRALVDAECARLYGLKA